MRTSLVKLLLILFLCVFLYALWQLLGIYSEYAKGSSEYSKLSEYAQESREEENSETGKETQDKEKGLTKLDIDFAALEGTNPDICGWIYLPGLDISYPIVKGEDDDYYLHHTFEGEENSAGCIFMEALNSRDFSDYNTFIYGHNMKNGSMFGSLKRYVREENCYEENPVFYIYNSKYIYLYRIYSYYITEPDSDTYHLPDSREDYERYMELVRGKSTVSCNALVQADRPTVTLSTCSGSGENKKRLVVHGILEETENCR